MSKSPIHIKNAYNVSRVKTLIDLSNDIPNYKLSFRLHSDSPFSALVLSQTTLDSVEDSKLEYVHVDSVLEGEVISDHNVTEPYYLILKSSTPCSVNVTFEISELVSPSEECDPPVSDSKPDYRVQVPRQTKYYNTYAFYLILLLFFGLSVYVWWAKKSCKSKETLLSYYTLCMQQAGKPQA